MLRLALSNQQFWATVTQPKKKTYYQILQLPTTATTAAIKKNYFKLAKIYHPDVYKGKDHTRFEKIQEAYKVLSDQSKRRTYDYQNGIRKGPQSQQSMKQSPREDFGKPKNTMDYQVKTQEINIDEEYEKFFKQKPKTHFEEIQMNEPIQIRSMSEAERIRRHFINVYDNVQHQTKQHYQKTFNTILNDQIDQKNQMFKDGVKVAEKMEAENNQQGLKKKKRKLYLLFGIVSLMTLPLFNSVLTKHELRKKEKETLQKWFKDAEKQAEQIQIRSRFQY